MTRNQLEWLTIQETKRSNLAKETETGRANRANEALTKARDERTHQTNLIKLGEDQRHNLTVEGETNRSNLAKEAETYRSNIAKEAETNRANLVKESQNWSSLFETNRHNTQTEALSAHANSLTARSIAVQANEADSRNRQREVQNVKTAMETLFIPKEHELQQQKQDFYETYTTEVETPIKKAELRRIDKDIDRLISQTTLNKASANKALKESDRTEVETKRLKADTRLKNAQTINTVIGVTDKIVELFN